MFSTCPPGPSSTSGILFSSFALTAARHGRSITFPRPIRLTGGPVPADYTAFDFLLGAIDQVAQVCTITSIGDNVGNAAGQNISFPGQTLSDVCMGTWGVTYPRTGFSNASSEPVASGISAYRASRVVANPFLRVVFMPKLFSPNPRMQLGYPSFGKPLNCFSKGTTPLMWDNGTTKPPKGAGYIWVLWEKTCCSFPSTGCLGLPPFI